jgi:RND family efflux transporter MFP subunit
VAKADLERVAALLQYARIVAPFDGVVTQRTVSPGDLAAPPRGRDAPLFTVARVDMVRVVVAVPDAHAARVRVGVDAAVRLDALPGQVFKGKVSRLAGALDPTKRTLRVEIDLPNRDGKLLPGVHGHVVLMLGQD